MIITDGKGYISECCVVLVVLIRHFAMTDLFLVLHSLLFVSSHQFGKSLKKRKKTESMNLISACFSVVDTTSTQMIGSALGSHGCACHCGLVIVVWSSDCVHRHACH